jgi:hypothetical protein
LLFLHDFRFCYVIFFLTLPFLFEAGLVLLMAIGRKSKPTAQELLKRHEKKRRSEQEENLSVAPHLNQSSKSSFFWFFFYESSQKKF